MEIAARLRVEGRGRLVEEDQFGPVDEGERERKALALAARECGEVGVGLVGETEAIEQLAGGQPLRIERAEQRQRFAGVIWSCSDVVCSAAPIFCFTSRGCRRASMPQTSMLPASGS